MHITFSCSDKVMGTKVNKINVVETTGSLSNLPTPPPAVFNASVEADVSVEQSNLNTSKDMLIETDLNSPLSIHPHLPN